MSFVRIDPGRCSICGAAHTACTASPGPISAVQFPARDRAAELVLQPRPVETPPRVDLGDGTDGRSFSTATYRGKRKARP